MVKVILKNVSKLSKGNMFHLVYCYLSGVRGGDGQCRGQNTSHSDNSSQFCHVLNQMYSGNNYHYNYEGSQPTNIGNMVPADQKCVTDYLAAYRHTHKQHYIQVN